ncbi:dextransucrase [Liquorilactobacillus aquaticus DSM 21051]|uniref:dextransucrase n=2 Tax=Liquorilactobacillus aquaticus TaxID=392566 RepID=A0A0R2D5G0_9LACO|nr:dextransucrase [Liquorilactobacillus aquaticus DSM 21051]
MYKKGKTWAFAAITVLSLALGTAHANQAIKAETINNNAVKTGKTSVNLNGTQTTATAADKRQATTQNNDQITQQATATAADKRQATTQNNDQAPQQATATAADKQQATTQNNDQAPQQATATAADKKQATTQNNDQITQQTTAIVADNTDDNLTKALADAKNVKTIDGKKYYIDDSGQIKKNFSIVVDGQTLYFDKNTGELTSTSNLYKEGLSNLDDEYTENNSAYDTSTKSFKTTDGYLTANSWYRPKNILRNGVQWEASSTTDYRPLLMDWWPDKKTQVNYLNFMQQQKLDNDKVYTVDDDQSVLNASAEQVQANIEKKISQTGDTQWLQSLITEFVNSQPNWNISSESQTTGDSKDHLQGGALLYENSDLTPKSNSNYRLLNRTPTNQQGHKAYTLDSSLGGYEFLLANDVDNSNPVVQAEQLNWMYYLLNFGSIVKNDADGNFDSIRVDAVDNVDADLLQIAGNYFQDAYKVNQSDNNANQHISILEDWSDNDAQYVKDHGSEQAAMDNKLRLSLKYALTMPYTDANKSRRSGLEPLITNSLVNRSNDMTENEAIPNYSFVRAHDSEVQTVIAEIIKEKIDPKSDGLTFTLDQLRQAFEIYNADQLKTDKQFTQYNIPSTYALLLTNKDTIPRIYYGDLFTDNGQYMANKSPYYSAIDTLLRARQKYVAGGQSMIVNYVEGSTAMSQEDYRGVLTSVRYGSGALTADDKGNTTTRTQGIAVIESNEPGLKLNVSDRIVVNMGKAHCNQAYRPLILTTSDGLATYQTDASVPASYIKYTDGNGQLIFESSEISGRSNPQVSGFLAAWVPVGAGNDQDARTESSSAVSTDGKTLHSNSALDSQVIYEGFSNFQDFPTTTEEYANVKIVENAELFKDWGITYFELPPQYRSSTDNSFLDSIIQNGYAFTDRYDLGFGSPTKYGTADQLISAVKALHAQKMKVIADWVPDQIYNLSGDEVVTAARINNFGEQNKDSVINKTLYVSKTVGGGKFQARYGGAFLKKIKKLYPDLFTMNQISTGVPIDASKRITQWSAKYFNGSNIQGRGAFYVLKDWGSNKYFKISKTESFLPKQLLNLSAATGFVSDGTGITYYSSSGYQAKETFIEDEKANWYYFDKNGHMQYGLQNVNGNLYYFLPNGVELRDAFFEDEKKNIYYFGDLGAGYANNYLMTDGKKWYYFDQNGIMVRGLVEVSFGGKTTTQYFDADGYQIKGQAIRDEKGNLRYFSSDSGDMEKNTFAEIAPNTWIYLGADGIATTGAQVINGQKLYFDKDGYQIKGQAVRDQDGNLRYYDADSGEMLTNRFERVSSNTWVYLGANGIATTGAQVINGQQLCFDKDGYQIKGQAVRDQDGNLRYYDADSGEVLTNRFERVSSNTWVYLGGNGIAVTGVQMINGQQFCFDKDGYQIKGQAVRDQDGNLRYYDADSGEMLTNRFVQLVSSKWIYLDNNGIAMVGPQTINGQQLYFDQNAYQVKGQYIVNSDGDKKYYAADSGELVEGEQH